MIILHENLPEEAEQISKSARKLYGIESIIQPRNFDSAFVPIPKFEGFGESAEGLKYFLREFDSKAVMVLTARDIYWQAVSKNDDWAFGYMRGNLMVASVARMRGTDSQPRQTLGVDISHYLKRVTVLALHEIGHAVIRASHYKMAEWVNAKTWHTMPLGPHCTDNKCLMYEVVDIKSPPAEEGFMKLGDEVKYDAGLDEAIKRMHSDFLCAPCKNAVIVDDSFR